MKKRIIALILSVAFCLAGCGGGNETQPPVNNPETVEGADTADVSKMEFSFTDRELSHTVEGAVDYAPGATITREGVYRLSGSIGGPIVVAAGENDKVQLVLDGANISCTDGPGIYIKSGDKVFLTLLGENTLTDGAAYADTYTAEGADGAIFSRADLAIGGTGSLTVNARCKHGIVSKDDLVITGGNITVNAPNVALNGKDCVKLTACTLSLTAGTDGIRSDNEEDSSRGFMYLKDGEITIQATNDAIQAHTVIKSENPTITVKTTSGKGIKAGSDIYLSGGIYNIDSGDDCIHANKTISISGGTATLTSRDDGVHADTDLEISGGELQVTKSYEGLEASRLLISGGKMAVAASDDGLNAAGGNDGSGLGGRPGQGMFSSSTGEIQIGGGYVVVDAKGDGIDSNGSIKLYGGVVLVSGPTNSGNGAFDYDGSAEVTGGYLLALGSAGMAQGFSSAENQGAVLCSFSTLQGGTSFAVCDSEGNVVISFTPQKNYACAAITAPGIQLNQTYTVVAGGAALNADENGFATDGTVEGGQTLGTFTMSSLVLGGGGGMGGPGGRPGGTGGGPGGRPR